MLGLVLQLQVGLAASSSTRASCGGRLEVHRLVSPPSAPLSGRLSDRLSDRLLDRLSDHLSGRLSGRLSAPLSGRLSGPLPGHHVLLRHLWGRRGL